MSSYFVYDNGNGSFDTFDTKEDAQKEAESILDAYRDEAPDGWADESLNLCWGVVVQSVMVANQEEYDPDKHLFSSDCDYVEERVLVSDETARVIATLEAKIIDLQAQLTAAKRAADGMAALERLVEKHVDPDYLQIDNFNGVVSIFASVGDDDELIAEGPDLLSAIEAAVTKGGE